MCPVKTCIAHSDKLKSGCIPQEVTDVNAQNAAYFKNISSKDAAREYAKGVEKLTTLSHVYYDINNALIPEKTCPKCHASVDICLEEKSKECKKRYRFYIKNAKRIPFSLSIKPEGFWHVFLIKSAENFVKPKIWDKGLSLIKTRKD